MVSYPLLSLNPLLGLILGSNSALSSRLFYFLLLLVSLGGLAAWLSLANWLKKTGYGAPWRIVASAIGNWKGGNLNPVTIPRLPSVRVTGNNTISIDPARTDTIKSPKPGIIIVTILAVALGWMLRDAQLHVPQRQYRDILVSRRHSSTEYELYFPGSGRYNITTCHPVDWQEDEKMSALSYVQRVGCKDVTIDGWYQFVTAPDGTRMKFNPSERELYAHE
jgi:hypothetical protein